MGETAVYTKILKQLLFSYAVNILVFIIAPIGTFVLSRGLSVSDFGVYALFFGWWNIGLQMFPFGFQLFIQNFLPGRSLSEQKQVMSVAFRFVFFILFLLFVMWFIFGSNMLAGINLDGREFELFLTLCAIMISVIAVLTHYWIVARQELAFANFLYLVNSSVWILLSLIEFLFTGKIVLWHVIFFWVVGAFLQLLFSLFKLGKDSSCILPPTKWDFIIFKRAILFGLPLIPLGVSQWLLTTFDRSLLSVYQGSAALGLYALAYALVNIIASFGTVVANIFYPYIAQAHNLHEKKEYNEFLNASLKYTLLMVLPSIFGIFVLRNEIITLFAGHKFISSEIFVKYLLFFPLFSSILLVFQTVVVVNKKSLSVSVVYLFSFFINYFLNRFLIPIYGGIGASLSTVITYLFLLLSMIFLSRGLFNIEWNFIKVKRIIFCSLVMAFLLLFMTPATAFLKFASILLGILVYFSLILCLGVFGTEELFVAKSLLFEKIDKLSSFMKFNF